jgi:chromosome segregation ATPase
VETLEEDIEALNVRVEELAVVSGRLEDKLSQERSKLASLELAREEELAATVCALFETVTSSRARSAGSLDKLNQMVASLSDELRRAEEAKAVLVSDISHRDDAHAVILHEQHVRAEQVAASLASAISKLEVAEASITELQQARDAAQSRLQVVECQLTDKTAQLEERALFDDEQTTAVALEYQRRLQQAEEQVSRLEDVRQVVEAELERTKAKLDAQIGLANSERVLAAEELEAKLGELRAVHTEEVESIRKQLLQVSGDMESLQSRLQVEAAARLRDEGEHQEKLVQATANFENAKQVVSQVEEDLAMAQSELQGTLHSVSCLEEERSHLHEKITDLEAEIQKCLSLQRYLESQVRDG